MVETLPWNNLQTREMKSIKPLMISTNWTWTPFTGRTFRPKSLETFLVLEGIQSQSLIPVVIEWWALEDCCISLAVVNGIKSGPNLLTICLSSILRLMCGHELVTRREANRLDPIGFSPNTTTFAISYIIGAQLFIFGGAILDQNRVHGDTYAFDTGTCDLFLSSLVTEEWKKVDVGNCRVRSLGTAMVFDNTVRFFGGYCGGAVDYYNEVSFVWTFYRHWL